MPKTNQKESVIYDWISDLTFQQQALLMTAMRGPDNAQKDNAAKQMVRYLRGVVLKAAGVCNIKMNDNSFMWGDYSKFGFEKSAVDFFDDHDAYPHHFMMHLIHCAAVVGYKHPDQKIRSYWIWFYNNMCNCFHMNPETEAQMDERLNDFDNIIP